MNRMLLFFFILLNFIMTSCAQNISKKDFLITIKTEYGDMVAILYDETPKHKKNFIKLAQDHFFDSTLFHRVIEGFMIQGGDPDSKNAKPGQRLGNGGPGYNVDAEFNPKFFHEKGALSAARLGDQMNPTKASSGSQFYIVQGSKVSKEELTTDVNKLNQGIGQLIQLPSYTYLQDTLKNLYYGGDLEAYKKKIFELAPLVEKELGLEIKIDISEEKVNAYANVGGAPHLDGAYTVFGKVIQGFDVLDKIAAQPKDGADRPLKDISMTITVEEMSKKKIEKLYHYQYPDAK